MMGLIIRDVARSHKLVDVFDLNMAKIKVSLAEGVLLELRLDQWSGPMDLWQREHSCSGS